MSDAPGPCRRCSIRGLVCQVDKQPQAIVSEDISRWRNNVTGQIQQLQTAVDVLLRMSDLPHLRSYNEHSPPTAETQVHEVEPRISGQSSDRDDSLPAAPIMTPVAPVDDNIYSLPINYLYEVTRLPSLAAGPASPSAQRSRITHDFISRGLVSETVAERLFTQFVSRIDYFCYGLMCPHATLESLRASSTVLTAAVCAVSALHDPEGSETFKVCHAEYQRLVMRSMFAVVHSTDDIRALIIGAYWFANLSYTLLGHTIRIAMRLNYHLAYYSAIRESRAEDIEKARLWYVLYILDHHSSILYGRPVMISAEEEPHQHWETFIQANGNEEVDLRMSSQVALYHITSKVKHIFGSHSTMSVPEHFLHQLRGYFSELDRWYMFWGDRMPRNAHIGWFPRDGAILHYHFARLHLCSYIFRGLSVESVAVSSPQVKEYANVAVSSATAVLELVMERVDLRTALVGMPIYFHAMITFAAVFLIKAAKANFPDPTAIDTPTVLVLVENWVRELRIQKASRQHLVYHLANGLEEFIKALSNPDLDVSILSGPIRTMGDSSTSTGNSMESMFMLDTFNLFQYPNSSGTLDGL